MNFIASCTWVQLVTTFSWIFTCTFILKKCATVNNKNQRCMVFKESDIKRVQGLVLFCILHYSIRREGTRNFPRSRINLNSIRYLRIYYPLDYYANSTWILLNVSFICLYFWISSSAIHFKVQILSELTDNF